jgi:hypothetical protein
MMGSTVRFRESAPISQDPARALERTDHRSTCRHFFSYRAGVLKVEHHGVGIQRERLLHATRMISGGKQKRAQQAHPPSSRTRSPAFRSSTSTSNTQRSKVTGSTATSSSGTTLKRSVEAHLIQRQQRHWSDSSAVRIFQILKDLLQNIVQAAELRIAQVVERLLKNPSGLCTHLFDGLPALWHQQHLGHSSIDR